MTREKNRGAEPEPAEYTHETTRSVYLLLRLQFKLIGDLGGDVLKGDGRS